MESLNIGISGQPSVPLEVERGDSLPRTADIAAQQSGQLILANATQSGSIIPPVSTSLTGHIGTVNEQVSDRVSAASADVLVQAMQQRDIPQLTALGGLIPIDGQTAAIVPLPATHAVTETPVIDRRLSQILPPLTGPHQVGYSTFVMEVPQAECSALGCDKNFGVEVFAPTRNPSANKLLMSLHGVSLSGEKKNTLYTNSFDRLDPMEEMREMPIVIFSHGLRSNPAESRLLIEELASHGFVVLNLNHPSSSAYAPFNQDAVDWEAFDGRRSSSHDPEKFFLEEADKMAVVQAANINFLVSKIRNGEIDELQQHIGLTEIPAEDSTVAGGGAAAQSPQSSTAALSRKNSSAGIAVGLNNQIILAGMSLGGAASIIASRENPDIAGCVNIDGALRGSSASKSSGLQQPVLLLTTENPPDDTGRRITQEWNTFIDGSSALATQKEIEGVGHMDFTIRPMLGWLDGAQEEDNLNQGLKAHSVASQEILKFLKNVVQNGETRDPAINDGSHSATGAELVAARTLESAPTGELSAREGLSLKAEIDKYLQDAVNEKHFRGTVLVIHNGEEIIKQGYGEDGLTNQTTFHIGSITKSFTAAMIMELHQSGRLSIEAPINDLLPTAFKCDKWDQIQVKHLLNHTSGIPSYGSDEGDEQHDYTLAEIVQTFKDKDLDFTPGSEVRYSNAGYALLGAIIENIYQKPFAECIDSQILRRFGMTSTGFGNTYNKATAAKGYEIKANEGGQGTSIVPVERQGSYLSKAHAAGALYSNLEDLQRFDAALCDDSFLTPQTRELMFTPAMIPGEELPTTQGLGFNVWKDEKLGLIVFKEGGIPGFSSMIHRYVDSNSCIIVLSNISRTQGLDNNHPTAPEIAMGIEGVLAGQMG